MHGGQLEVGPGSFGPSLKMMSFLFCRDNGGKRLDEFERFCDWIITD